MARRLADLYEGPIHDPKKAIRALELVHKLEPEDYQTIGRLDVLCEAQELWPRVVDAVATHTRLN